MNGRIAVVAATSLMLVAGGTSGALAATKSHGAAAAKVTIKERQTLKMKPNRYILDGLRWDKDVYTVKSGGTLHLVNSVITEGPHTFTIVRPQDLPRTAAQVQNCKICNQLGAAHGADPNSEAPPKFQFLENGVGQSTPPSIDRPGDSALIGPGQKRGESVDVTVTAKKGTTLHFLCLIHPWMQGTVKVR